MPDVRALSGGAPGPAPVVPVAPVAPVARVTTALAPEPDAAAWSEACARPWRLLIWNAERVLVGEVHWPDRQGALDLLEILGAGGKTPPGGDAVLYSPQGSVEGRFVFPGDA